MRAHPRNALIKNETRKREEPDKTSPEKSKISHSLFHHEIHPLLWVWTSVWVIIEEGSMFKITAIPSPPTFRQNPLSTLKTQLIMIGCTSRLCIKVEVQSAFAVGKCRRIFTSWRRCASAACLQWMLEKAILCVEGILIVCFSSLFANKWGARKLTNSRQRWRAKNPHWKFVYFPPSQPLQLRQHIITDFFPVEIQQNRNRHLR